MSTFPFHQVFLYTNSNESPENNKKIYSHHLHLGEQSSINMENSNSRHKTIITWQRTTTIFAYDQLHAYHNLLLLA